MVQPWPIFHLQSGQRFRESGDVALAKNHPDLLPPVDLRVEERGHP